RRLCRSTSRASTAVPRTTMSRSPVRCVSTASGIVDVVVVVGDSVVGVVATVVVGLAAVRRADDVQAPRLTATRNARTPRHLDPAIGAEAYRRASLRALAAGASRSLGRPAALRRVNDDLAAVFVSP